MADGFLSRWSRLKTEAREATQAGELPVAAPATAPVPVTTTVASSPDSHQPEAAGEARPALPTLDDAMRLGPDSDYSAFVARGVDSRVRRQALRKLFSDPHFNVVDGLDVYMGDYTRADPIAPAMLASLQHAGAWLRTQLEDADKEAAGAPAARTAQQQPEPHQVQQHAQQNLQQEHLPDQHKATAPQSAPAREHDEH